MNKDRILESWQKINKLPLLPDYLQRIIHLCNSGEDKENIDPYLNDYLISKKEQFTHCLELSAYGLKHKPDHLIDLFRTGQGKILRNLAFLFWFQENEPVKFGKDFDLEFWKEDAFASAFISLCLARMLSPKHAVDIFLQAYLKDIGLLTLSVTFPKIYEGISKLSLIKRLEPSQQEKVIGCYPGELSAWILQNWGFSEEFYQCLQGEYPLKNANLSGKIIYFSRFAADYLLNRGNIIKYTDLEVLFKKLFDRNARDFQELLVETVRILPGQAACFGIQKLIDLTIIDVLKDHLNVFDQNLLTYNDLLNEALKAHKRILVQEREIRQLKNQLEKRTVKDDVTGMYNHTYFREFLVHKIREAERYEYPLTLILFDLDNFHTFNKEFGYPAGNELLRQLAELVRDNIRQSDILARYGADEFAIVLPYTGLPNSRLVAEKIVKLISKSRFKDSFNYKSHQITISVGFTSILPDASLVQDENLIRAVLKALKQSQKTGGNSITQAEA